MKFPVAIPFGRRDSSRPISLAEQVRRGFVVLCWLTVAASVLGVLIFAGQRFNHFVHNSPFFTIEEVRVSGASTQLEEEIRAVVDGMEAAGQSSLLMFKLSHARFRIEALPQVKSLELEKSYPRTLLISVEERQPVAALNAGELFWVDVEGVLLGRATPTEIAQGRSTPLSGVTESYLAPGMRVEDPRILETLQMIQFLKKEDPPLARRFAQWHVDPSHQVFGILHEGVEIRFGDTPPMDRLPVLASVMRQKSDLSQYTYVDLRFDDQVVLF